LHLSINDALSSLNIKIKSVNWYNNCN
jgi:hypothetical protein